MSSSDVSPPGAEVASVSPTGAETAPLPTRLPTPELAWQPAAQPPGGYWQFGEKTEPEPPDGDEALTIGSVLLSLGALRAGTGGASVWMAIEPDRCPAKDARGCEGLLIYGWSGVGLGALSVVTGIVYLGIGAAQRARHQRWQRGTSRARLSPWWIASPSSRTSAGLGVQVRFRF